MTDDEVDYEVSSSNDDDVPDDERARAVCSTSQGGAVHVDWESGGTAKEGTGSTSTLVAGAAQARQRLTDPGRASG